MSTTALRAAVLPAALFVLSAAAPAGAQLAPDPFPANAPSDVDPFAPRMAFASRPSRNAPAETLVQAQFNQVADKFGFQWNIDSQGYVSNGSPAFNYVGMIEIEGNGFSPNQHMMTADGREFVLSGNHPHNNIQITRRVKVDAETGTVRWLDVFTNPLPNPVTVNVKIRANLQGQAQGVVTDAGGQLAQGFGEKDSGLVIPPRRPNTPSPMFFVTARGSKLRPQIQPQGNELWFTYPLTIPAGETASILHGVGRRNWDGRTDKKSLAALFAPFGDRKWTQDLPKHLKKTIANAPGANNEDVTIGPLLQPLLTMADDLGVEIGPRDVLVAGEDAQLAGAVSGDELVVEGRFGEVTLARGDVAAVRGGAGVDRLMRVYLRNGEILAGRVRADGWVMETDSGLSVRLDPEQVEMLFLRVAAEDGRPAPGTGAMVDLHAGDRLALAADAPFQLDTITPWGPLVVGFDQLDRLKVVRDVQPIHRLALRDGSRLYVMLPGRDLTLQSPRLGAVHVNSSEIAELLGLKPSASQTVEAEPALPGDLDQEQALKLAARLLRELGDDALAGRRGDAGRKARTILAVKKKFGALPDGADETALKLASEAPAELEPAPEQESEEQTPVPRCELAGDNLLVGRLDAQAVEVETPAGLTTIDLARLRAIRRADDEARSFTFELADGGEVVGRLHEPTLLVHGTWSRWTIPVHHLAALVLSEDDEETKETPAAASAGNARQPGRAGARPTSPSAPPRSR